MEKLDLGGKFEFSPGPEGCVIKSCFVTIERLAIGFNCVEGILLNQNSAGVQLFIVNFRLIFSSTGQGGSLDKKLL